MTLYGICLYPKYGEHRYLGSKFATLEELQSYVDREVCTRCNRVEHVHISEDSQWEDSRVGFVECSISKRVHATPSGHAES
jgi:hypothetical protein